MGNSIEKDVIKTESSDNKDRDLTSLTKKDMACYTNAELRTIQKRILFDFNDDLKNRITTDIKDIFKERYKREI